MIIQSVEQIVPSERQVSLSLLRRERGKEERDALKETLGDTQ